MSDIQITTADMLEIYVSGGNGAEYVNFVSLCETAAAELREKDAEITRLRAENERLREALDEIANGKLLFPNYSFWLRDRAREALKENSDE